MSFNLRAVDRNRLAEILKELWPYLVNLDAYVKPLPEEVVNRLDRTANVSLDLREIETAGSALPKDVAQDYGTGQKRQGERQGQRAGNERQDGAPGDEDAGEDIAPLI